MKILIPVIEFGKAGGYRVLSNLANEFIKKGHTVHFLTTNYSRSPYFPTTAHIFYADRMGNLVTELQSGRKRSHLSDIKAVYRALKKIACNDQYDIVLANQSMTPFPIYLSNIKSAYAYYIQSYEPDIYKYFKNKKYLLLSWISIFTYYLPFTKIVNTPLFLHYKKIKTSNLVLPGLDLENYYPKNGYMQKTNVIKIGTVGRIEKYKGTQYVVDAFKEIKKIYKNVELHIAFGNTELKNESEGIFVCSPDGDKILADFYRSLDVYICAGIVEHGAVHYPVIESMASGTAVITTNYYPASHENSWLIKSQDIESIVQQFGNIVTCSQEEYKSKLLNAVNAIQQFSWNKVSDDMLAIFERIRLKHKIF